MGALIDTVKLRVHGEVAAMIVARDAVRASVWYEVTPYPEDVWVFTFKPEARQMFEELIKEGERTQDAIDSGVFI